MTLLIKTPHYVVSFPIQTFPIPFTVNIVHCDLINFSENIEVMTPKQVPPFVFALP